MIAIVSVLGTVVGIVSGFFGGLLDTVIMRLTDILLAFPDTVFAIAIVGMMGPGLLNTVIALSFVWWTKYARMARGLASVIRTKDYITEARVRRWSEQQGFCSDMHCRISFPKWSLWRPWMWAA